MNYTKVTFTLSPMNEVAREILQAQLGDLGYESFVDTEDGCEGYVQTNSYDPSVIAGLDLIVPDVSLSFAAETVPDTDWNAEWEKSFASIRIADDVLVRSPFAPSEDARYEIIISPRMAFGTGKHETTQLMTDWLVSNDVSSLSILDMGCGTGILGILALLRGASDILWVDFDEWCVENTLENLRLNNITGRDNAVLHGGAEKISDRTDSFDVVLANINRNVLVKDMDAYANALRHGGRLVLSGFYDIDVKNLTDRASACGLDPKDVKVLNDWARIVLVKR